MAISVKPLGAGQEVGRSCVIVKIKNVKVMFDCGVHMAYNDNRKFPDFKKIIDARDSLALSTDKFEKFDTNMTSNSSGIPTVNNNNMYQNFDEKINYTSILDLVIITHFHLDHCGALPYFTEICGYNGPIITTQPTKAILPITLEDFRKIISDYRGERSPLLPEQITSCVNKIQTIEIGETRVIGERIKVTAFYAGHVLGAGIYKIEVDGYSVVYTGDYNTLSDRHLAGAYVPRLYPNILITETTYGDTVRDTKRVREREFLKKIQVTIDKGGKVLIPIFALGRAQELCILLDTYWKRTKCEIPIYFAGPLAEKANFYYKLFSNWMNSKVKNIYLTHNVFDFTFVKQGDKSVTKSHQPMVIFATPGMLHGGLSLSIFKEIATDPKNCVIIPGYCTTGTVGNKLLSGERVIEIDKQNVEVKCEIYYMSFSAHADAKGLLELIKNVSPKNLVLVHGDAEVMKKFQKTVETSLNINTTMPENFSEIFFNLYLFYHQIDISIQLFNALNLLLTSAYSSTAGTVIKNFPGIEVINKGERLCLKYSNPLLPNIMKYSKKQQLIINNKLIVPFGKNVHVNIPDFFFQFMEKYYPAILAIFKKLLSDQFLLCETKPDGKVELIWSYDIFSFNEKKKSAQAFIISKYLDTFAKCLLR